MEIGALLDYLKRTRAINQLVASPITQWGPSNRRMLSPNFLPPRTVQDNYGTEERVRFRTVAAVDGDRYSPAQMVDSGELFGRLHWRLGHSDLTRQIAGSDYDGIVNYLNQNLTMDAAARVVGLTDTLLLQGMVEHDELMNWDAIVLNSQTRRGSNGYLEYEEGPSLDGHRVSASVDWTDSTTDPWTSDIIPRVMLLQDLGYSPAGIRVVTTYKVLQTLADHPATMRRIISNPLYAGQSIQEAIGILGQSDVVSVMIRKLGIKSVDTHDLRIQTKTGEKRAYPEGHMTFIASTGISEEVRYNVDDPSQVMLIENTLGFTGIGRPNGVTNPGRQVALRSFSNQKDSRIELEGWQTTGPVILEPQAITDIGDITYGSVY